MASYTSIDRRMEWDYSGSDGYFGSSTVNSGRNISNVSDNIGFMIKEDKIFINTDNSG